MKLHYSATSPYVRKVLVVAHETGLIDRIQLAGTNPWAQEDALVRDNPLSKVPTLVTTEAGVLYDSPVICEYLDSLHGGPRLVPADGPERWQVLHLQALGDGILDAAVALRMERMRPQTERSASWQELQAATVERGVEALQNEDRGWGTEIDLGRITAGCALGYLDFRFPEIAWRDRCPRPAAWFEVFSARESMAATAPPPDA